ncbi:MAG: hypothetical protein H0V66_11180 [Bdellovibrionales bacterium]|nr:hypothetical protein [Bdellovibrionales bacterium]
MNILFLSILADYLVPKIQLRLSPEQKTKIHFFDELNIPPEQADIIFMDYSIIEYSELFYEMLKSKKKVVLLINEDHYNEINKILYETGVNHLFCVSENSLDLNYISDISEFIQNWSQERNTANIMPVPKHVTTTKIISSKNVDLSIENLLKGHDFTNCFDGLPSLITNILDEALSNALFNAPVDKAGIYLYRNHCRSEIVKAIPGKEVEVSLLTDDKDTVISIKDFYGTLTENNLFDYPPAFGEERKKDMRLGMYLIFRYGHKYLINVSQGSYTENIIVIENSRRFKNYDLRERSFHFFIKEQKIL